MNDRNETLTADELETEANRARERLASTIDELRLNLRPKHLAREWARSSGLGDMTAGDTLERAYRRHPVALALCGVGAGFLAYTAARRTASASPQSRQPFATSLGEIFGRLADSVTSVIHERAKQNSERLLKVAQTHVASTTDHMSAAVERGVEEWLAKIPGPPAAQPLVAAAAQLLIAAALQAALRK
jgi:hypothetical protein